MTVQNSPSSELFRVCSDLWQEAIDRKDFHAAVAAGISAYLVLHRRNEDQLAKGALSLMHVAIDGIMDSHRTVRDEMACSFCGRSGPDVRLGAAPDACICSECVAALDQAFNDPHS
jgi:hypothetical protein